MNCYNEARQTFNRTYSKTNFFIESTNGGIIDYNKQSVRINNFNVAKNVLNLFGDMVQFLNISFIDIDEVKGNEIIGHVTANCTKSLKELHLYQCHGHVLDQLNQPFQYISIASFVTHSNIQFEITPNALELNQLFPNLKRLHVKITSIDDLAIVGDQFSQLQSIIVDLPEISGYSLVDIENIFKASPNINSLTVHHCTLKLLKIASLLLSNLKVLRIFDFSNELYRGSRIHFKNVKHLYVTNSQNCARNPDKLVFYQLRKLSLNLNVGFTDQWIIFFGNQVKKSIEFFDLKTDMLTTNQLLAIVENMPNMKMASFIIERKLSADSIIKFLQTSKQLLVFQTHNALIDVIERKQLDEVLYTDWDINYSYPSINVIAITCSR